MRTELLDLSKIDGCACGGRCVGCNDAATAVGTRVYERVPDRGLPGLDTRRSWDERAGERAGGRDLGVVQHIRQGAPQLGARVLAGKEPAATLRRPGARRATGPVEASSGCGPACASKREAAGGRHAVAFDPQLDNPHEPIDPTAEPVPWGGIDEPKGGPRNWFPGGPGPLPKFDARTCANLDGENVDPGSPFFDPNFVLIGDSKMSTYATDELDDRVKQFMRRNDIPNVALAVVSGDGRLVYSKGFTNRTAYSLAREEPYFVDENSRFRIGSLSKVITGVATLRAMEMGLFSTDLLEARVSDYVDLTSVPVGWDGPANRALRDIQIRHLLLHTAGWVSDLTLTDDGHFLDAIYPPVPSADAALLSPGFDFLSDLATAATVNRSTYPVTPDHVTRWGNTYPLSWAPGDDFVSYSNYGYFLLGRVIEGASCRSYESFVKEYVLAPIGMVDTMVGSTERSQRAIREVPYYTQTWPWQNAEWMPVEWQSVSDGSSMTTPDLPDEYRPYAERDVRMAAATGGWIASVRDMARFCKDLFVGPSSVLSPTSVGFATTRASETAADGSTGWTFGGLYSSVGQSPTTLEYFDIFEKSGHARGAAAFLWSAGPSTRQYANASFVLLTNRSWGGLNEGGLVDDIAHIVRNPGSGGWGMTTDDLF